MAAVSSNGRAIGGSFGKRLINQISTAKHCDTGLLLISRRASHSSSDYDKNADENASPVIVPDHVIGTRPENYWGPHPTTGVFGPDDPKAGEVASVSGRPNPPESGNRGSSALDETVRFRQLELEDREPEDQK
ncbi:hypothetical protein M5K25_010225 [Dendrobium thyrsiflorum]|uniref:Late embryogenesis abundant protein n=1 Tax=Dendrobium thyrsiflorum TaxID=117978 RepID=A0ABD0UZ46_DENTH